MCGRLTSSTVGAGGLEVRRPPRGRAASTPGSMPATKYSRRQAESPAAEPRGGLVVRDGRCRRSSGTGIGAEVESRSSRPDDRVQQRRGVTGVAPERSDLVERAGEGDEAVAADPAVGRLHPDDPAERGRLADRAAGVACRWTAARGTRPPRPPSPRDEPPGTRSRSQGFDVGPKAEFSVDEPIANSSMFVLPRMTAPASRRRSVMWASNGAR